MRDEEKFPTMRFLTCKACGQAFTASLSGFDSCPSCQTPARPGDEPKGVASSGFAGHVLLTVAGPIYRMRELEALKVAIDDALKGGPDSIAFHFDGASYLDSSMLSQIVRTLQEMSKRGKPTYVITGDAQVMESLQILDLDRVLTVLPSLEAWRRTFGGV